MKLKLTLNHTFEIDLDDKHTGKDVNEMLLESLNESVDEDSQQKKLSDFTDEEIHDEVREQLANDPSNVIDFGDLSENDYEIEIER